MTVLNLRCTAVSKPSLASRQLMYHSTRFLLCRRFVLTFLFPLLSLQQHHCIDIASTHSISHRTSSEVRCAVLLFAMLGHTLSESVKQVTLRYTATRSGWAYSLERVKQSTLRCIVTHDVGHILSESIKQVTLCYTATRSGGHTLWKESNRVTLRYITTRDGGAYPECSRPRNPRLRLG